MAVFIEKSFADECATGSVGSFISAQFRRKLFRKLAVFSVRLESKNTYALLIFFGFFLWVGNK